MNFMKKIFYIILFLMAAGCGQGVSELSHNGVCDGYADWNTSNYKLPWPAGASYEISQGNCGPASHLGAHRYSYDISMTIGSSIVAARGGVVESMEEQYNDGGGCAELNYISIRHTDGTLARYLHLTHNGVLVNKGATVNQGDAIALSGNSGCSSGAHLHFMVLTPDEADTVPVTFSNTTSNVRGLISGNNYTAQ
jgi:murein DD-endopeptidase MepM/ murein hydrolase activator NlpD